MFHLPEERFVVAYPLKNKIEDLNYETIDLNDISNTCLFFYPAMPRPFKNFEVICESVKLLKARNIKSFAVIFTIDGKENNYSKHIYRKYHDLKEIHFVGLLPINKVFAYYQKSLCLIFSSKLETWGLLISEYSTYNKPMLIADLPYAHETASGASLVNFFMPNDAVELSNGMEKIINKDYTSLHPVPL